MSNGTSTGDQSTDTQVGGKPKLPPESLPLGNYYCLWCERLGFVIPKNGVVETPVFCEDCDGLFAEGIL